MPADLVTDAPPGVRVPPDPMAILAHMVERGVEPDKLSAYLDFVERVAARQAAERFAEALAAFQSEVPAVLKDRKAEAGRGKDGQPSKFGGYNYASLDDVMAVAGPVMARHGITVGFDTQHEAGKDAASLKVVVRVRVGSHFEDKTFLTPVPVDMFVNQTQKFGAALTYAKRYALCAALNIVTTDQDTDAEGLVQYVTAEEVGQLNDLIVLKQVKLDKFLEWASTACKVKIADLDLIPRQHFEYVLSGLKKKETPK